MVAPIILEITWWKNGIYIISHSNNFMQSFDKKVKSYYNKKGGGE